MEVCADEEMKVVTQGGAASLGAFSGGNNKEQKQERRKGSFEYSNPKHTSQILQGLDAVQDSKEFSDITLQVGDMQFECHKLILSLSTPYFRTMFTSGMKESSAATVTIRGIEPAIFSKIVDYIYKGKIQIMESDFQPLLEAGNMLQLETLCDGCAKYLEEELASSNCLGFWLFGQRINNDSLVNTALAYSRQHFDEVQLEEEFFNLSAEELCKYISDDSINVKSEDEVGQGVMSWFMRDPQTRTAAMKGVLLHVRLNHLSMEYLRLNMMRCGQLKESPECMQLVDRAMDMQLFPEAHIFDLQSTFPRLSMGAEQCLLVFARTPPRQSSVRYSNNTNKVTRYHHYDEGDYNQSYHGGRNIEGRLMHGIMLQRTPVKVDTVGCAAHWVTNERVAACTVRNEVFIVGVGGRCDEIWKYDGQRGDWQKCASLSKLCSPSAVVAVGEKIYIFGGITIDRGETTRIPLPDFEEYCIRTNRCRVVGELQRPVQDMACAVHQGIIYVIGGTGAILQAPIAFVQLVNTNKNPPTVEQGTPMPEPPARLSVVQYEDRLLVVTDKAMLSYNIPSDSWQTLPSLAAGSTTFSCCLSNHHIYVVGGQRPTDGAPPAAEDEATTSDDKKDEPKQPDPRDVIRYLAYGRDDDDDEEVEDAYEEYGDDVYVGYDAYGDEMGLGLVAVARRVNASLKQDTKKTEQAKSEVLRVKVESVLAALADPESDVAWEQLGTLPREKMIVYSVCSVIRPIPAEKEKKPNY